MADKQVECNRCNMYVYDYIVNRVTNEALCHKCATTEEHLPHIYEISEDSYDKIIDEFNKITDKYKLYSTYTEGKIEKILFECKNDINHLKNVFVNYSHVRKDGK